MGSPPLTRGIQQLLYNRNKHPRFTPAHAGNTQEPIYKEERIWVHPRSRGEYGVTLATNLIGGGSPPLTRGIHIPVIVKALQYRFTPAHAGNTGAEIDGTANTRVHPRSRGEYQWEC